MTRLLSTLLLAGLAWIGGASAQSLDQRHNANTQSQICCGPNNIVNVDGAGPVSAPNWFATAGADGSAAYGLTTGSAQAAVAAPTDAFGSAGATARDLFVDHITVVSDTLAAGTWVTVQAIVVLQASVEAEGQAGSGTIGRASAAWHFGGPDAPWLAGVTLERGEFAGAAGYGAASERVAGQASFQARIGDVLQMAGDSVFHASAGGIGVTRQGSAEGTAWFFLAGDGANLGFLGASGHDYTAPVPEPASALLLLLGGAGLWAARRRA